MPSTLLLLPKLKKAFPDITFAPAEMFAWSPDKKTVFYSQSDEDKPELLLHELSHGLLGHHDYHRDVELLAMETAAWDKARSIAPDYDFVIDQELAEDNLETYREWLHSRSTCPQCEANGYQNSKNTYECVACGHGWRVNEARLCGLRRYSLTK